MLQRVFGYVMCFINLSVCSIQWTSIIPSALGVYGSKTKYTIW